MTFISELHSMIVIPGFKFVLSCSKVVLPRICAVYLYLVHKTLLEAVPVHWAACFVSAITHSGWLFKYIYIYIWHDTQTTQISQKQDERNIYAIMKTMCPPGYHHNGFVTTHGLGHKMW